MVGDGEECDDGNTESEDGCSSSCACEDRDHDGVSSCGDDNDLSTVADNDCDDSNANSYPGNEEICDDGRDNDCDGIENE